MNMMYKQTASCHFDQTVDFLERVGEALLVYVAQFGFTLFDASLQPLWQTECSAPPFSLYVNPDGSKALAWFAEEEMFGVLGLNDGEMSYFAVPFCFRSDCFSNLHHWQDDEVFLYSAESDVVAVNVVTQTMRHSRYEEAPLFGDIVETAYPRAYDFEAFHAPSTITLYDEETTRFLVHDTASKSVKEIPYDGDRTSVILDHYNESTVVASETYFQLYHAGTEVFASEVCDDSELLKILLLNETGTRIAVLSVCKPFNQNWLQVFGPE